MSNTVYALFCRDVAGAEPEGGMANTAQTLQERRVVMHYVTTLPQRKGPEEQNAIGFAAAVGEPMGWRWVGFS